MTDNRRKLIRYDKNDKNDKNDKTDCDGGGGGATGSTRPVFKPSVHNAVVEQGLNKAFPANTATEMASAMRTLLVAATVDESPPKKHCSDDNNIDLTQNGPRVTWGFKNCPAMVVFSWIGSVYTSTTPVTLIAQMVSLLSPSRGPPVAFQKTLTVVAAGSFMDLATGIALTPNTTVNDVLEALHSVAKHTMDQNIELFREHDTEFKNPLEGTSYVMTDYNDCEDGCVLVAVAGDFEWATTGVPLPSPSKCVLVKWSRGDKYVAILHEDCSWGTNCTTPRHASVWDTTTWAHVGSFTVKHQFKLGEMEWVAESIFVLAIPTAIELRPRQTVHILDFPFKKARTSRVIDNCARCVFNPNPLRMYTFPNNKSSRSPNYVDMWDISSPQPQYWKTIKRSHLRMCVYGARTANIVPHPTNEYLLLSQYSLTADVVDLGTGKRLFRGSAQYAQFSPSGHYFATLLERCVYFYNTLTWTCVFKWTPTLPTPGKWTNATFRSFHWHPKETHIVVKVSYVEKHQDIHEFGRNKTLFLTAAVNKTQIQTVSTNPVAWGRWDTRAHTIETPVDLCQWSTEGFFFHCTRWTSNNGTYQIRVFKRRRVMKTVEDKED